MDITSPRISIAMTVYNAEQFVAKALESLLWQNYTNFEIIISDNGSEDRSGEICREYARHDNRITYFRNDTNIGIARNFAKAFAHCSADYFMFVADHDIYHPDFISTLITVITSDTSIVLAYPRTILIDTNDQPIEMMGDTIDTQGLEVSDRVRKLLWEFSAGNMYYGLFRMSAFRKVWSPYPVIGSDWVLLTKLSLEGPIAQVDTPLFFRRRNRPDENVTDMVNRQVGLFVSNNFESLIPWTRLAYEQVKVIVDSGLHPDVINQLLEEVVLSYRTRFGKELREEAVRLVDSCSPATTCFNRMESISTLELSRLAGICKLFCPEITKLDTLIHHCLNSSSAPAATARKENTDDYPPIILTNDTRQKMTWETSAGSHHMKLYAGDVPEMAEYDGWIGLSITKSDNRHIFHDITNPFPIPDNSVGAFQAEDVIEHIPYDKLVPVFDEIYRILEPGAMFRLSVPDYGCDVLRDRSVQDGRGNFVFDPGGGGTPDNPGHLWFPRIENVYRLLEKTRFFSEGRIVFLHYWNMSGSSFVAKSIDYAEGFIKRTPDHDDRVKTPYRPMSLVADLYKAAPPTAKEAHKCGVSVFHCRNISAYPHGWQTPAITEQYAYERAYESFPERPDVAYIGFPWATLIDFLQSGREEKAKPYLEKLRELSVHEAPVRITVAQHIYAARYIELFESAGVTDLFWSHATTDTERIGSIRIHPFPLFPVRCQDEPDRPAKPLSDRRYLFSFVGAYDPKYYLTPVRDWIGSLPRTDEGRVRVTKEWHFYSDVYERQIFDTPVAEEKRAHLDRDASEYRDLLTDSIFSLCPSGSGPNSIRLWESLGFGCIPVIIADTLRLPGDLNEWRDAAIFVREDQASIAALPGTLRAVADDVDRLQEYVQAGQRLWKKYGPESFIHDILRYAESGTGSTEPRGGIRQAAVPGRPRISPDTFADYSFAKRHHFACFGEYDLELFNRRVDPDNCDLKAYQDLLVFAFIKDNIPKGSKILDVGGGESRILAHFRNDYECWNVDKLEGSGNGPVEINHAGYRLVRDYMGNFSSELPESFFDFVFSISSLEHVPYGNTEHRELHKNICLDIDRVLKPGGISLHCFDIAISSVNNCWTNDLAPFMADCFANESNITSLTHIAKDPQLFTVSERYFNTVWKQHPNVSWDYEDGKPSSWNIMWRKPLSLTPDDAAFGWHHISKYRVRPDTARPKISVVTPSFNQAEFLEECIQSIVGQNYPNLEYIIMDGGSTDGSVEIIKRYQQFIAYWQSKPDGGQYQAIQDGFRRTSGEIMTWLNSDDKFHPNAFATVSGIFSGRPDVHWIMGRPNGFDDAGTQTWVFDYLPRWSREKYLQKKYRDPYIQQEGTFWRRSLWEQAGACFETGLKLAGDLELWTRFFRHTQLHTVDALLAGYRSHPAQKTRNFLEQYHEEAEQVLDREIKLFRNGGEQTLLPAPPPLIPDADAGSGSEIYLVSAIISTYKSENFLSGCLEDLVHQTLYRMGQLEIIIIDSASPEKEGEIAREFQQTFAHIRHIRTQERESLYSSWNRAIEMACGRYITNANTDDRHRHDSLEVMCRKLEENPAVDLVYGDCYVSTIPNETFEENSKTRLYRYPEFFAPAVLLHYQFGPQPMWRKSVHDKVGYFDGSFRAAGDYDFNIRFALTCKALHIPESLGLYLEHEAAISFKDDTMARENSRIADSYRKPEIIESLYLQEGVSVATATCRANIFIDMGNRALEYYPPWREGISECKADLAVWCYDKALELQPELPEALNNRAVVMYLTGNPSGALRLLNEALPSVSNPTIHANITVFSNNGPNSDLRLIPSGLQLPSQRDLSLPSSTHTWMDKKAVKHLTICMVASLGPIDPIEGGGGLESAMRHTATALSRRGHRVALVGRLTREPGVYEGVEFLPLERWENGDFPSFSKEADIIAFASGPDLGSYRHAGRRTARIALFHHQQLSFMTGGDPLEILNRHSDAIICVSDAVKANLTREKVDQNKLVTIPNGIDLQVFYPRYVTREPHRILFAGALVPDKNVHLLIEAFLRIQLVLPDSELHICGSAALWGAEEYIDREAVRRLTSKIIFHGKVSQEELAVHYSRASLCVIPSRFESFSLVSLEAQACGCVPLVANVGGVPETIEPGETGFLYHPNNVDALFMALHALLCDPPKVSLASSKAVESVKVKYSWEKTAQKYEKVFYNALEIRHKISFSQDTKPKESRQGPKVSVIIPCYNYANYLGEAVQSVINQTFRELEIIIVNDGSTDNTVQVAEQIIAAHPQYRIRLITQANSGQPAASRNRGISEARGEYILPLDADDIIHPTLLQKMVDILEGNDTVDIVYSDTIRFGDTNNSYQTEEWDLQRLATVNIINYCALFRRKVWEEVGGYRLDCGYEDWDFWISAAEKGFTGYRIPEYLFYYRIKQSGRLLQDQQNDSRIKAMIVRNHPNLYDDATRAWSTNLLSGETHNSKPLRVLFVVHNFPPHWFAGVEIYTFHLATSLIKQGIDVSVLYPLHREGILQPKVEEGSYEGITVFRLLSDHTTPQHANLSSQISNEGAERTFTEFLSQRHFDTIHFHHTLSMPFSFIKVARQQGYPVCVTLHDFWFLCVNIHLYNTVTNTLCSGPSSVTECATCLLNKLRYPASSDEKETLKKWIDVRVSNSMDILRNADCVVSPSHYLADIHRNFGLSRTIEISPLGLNPVKRSSRTTGSPVVFGFLGNIHDLKNVYMLSESFREVCGEARLIFFGDGAPLYLQKLSNAIEGDARIEYRGGYSPDQLAEVLEQVDIVVVPSITENYPLVVREALSAGVPVIASRVGGIPEIVTHLRNGILFDPTSKDELRKWLQTVTDNPSLIQELKQNILPVKTMEQDAAEWANRYARFHRASNTLKPIPSVAAGSVESELKVAVFSLDAIDDACAVIRLVGPLQRLGTRVSLLWGAISDGTTCSTNLDLIEAADILVIQRFYPRNGTLPFIERMLASGKPVIYESDDLITDLPESNHLKPWAEETATVLRSILPRFTAITTSTPLLAEAFSHYNPNAFAIPNLVDETLFSWVKTAPKKSITIGFCGTGTHADDLGRIDDTLFRIADKYGERVSFLFMGYATPKHAQLPGFTFIDFERSYQSYGKLLSSSGIDIALVPLADNSFNRCKSNIKWLEYSACGIAGIYADLPPYNTCVEHGKTGILVDSAPDKWLAAICLMIEHAEIRQEIARRARETVVAHYSLESGAQKHLDTYGKIMDDFQTRCSASAPPMKKSFSIIIPIFNQVSYTRQCLDGIMRNTGSIPYELVLVDNGSTDETGKLLAGQKENVKVISNPRNLGFARACNQGAEAATGDYLVFLNNDTIPQPGWLEALAEAMETEKADICGSRLLYPDGKVQHAGVAFDEAGIGYHIFKNMAGNSPAVNKRRFMQSVTGACMLISKGLFQVLGGFDESFLNGYEDVDLCLRAGQLGKKVLYVPESVLIHFEEKSDGRKFHDDRNMKLFLSRWGGKVRCDDDLFYQKEGYMQQLNAEGKIVIRPINQNNISNQRPGA